MRVRFQHQKIIVEDSITRCGCCERKLHELWDNKYFLCKYCNRFFPLQNSLLKGGKIMTPQQREYNKKTKSDKKEVKMKPEKQDKNIHEEAAPRKNAIRVENATRIFNFIRDDLKIIDLAEARKTCSNCIGQIIKAQDK